MNENLALFMAAALPPLIERQAGTSLDYELLARQARYIAKRMCLELEEEQSRAQISQQTSPGDWEDNHD